MFIRKFCLLLFIILFTNSVSAIEVLSREITWNHLGGKAYDVFLTEYTTCATTGLDTSIRLQVITATDTLSVVPSGMPALGIGMNYPSIGCYNQNLCANKYANFFTRRVSWRFRVDLSGDTNCMVKFRYEDCCRPQDTTTLAVNGASQAIESVLYTCKGTQQNSPVFVNFPQIGASDGDIRQLSFMALDTFDGFDSIAYSFVSPLDSAGPVNYSAGYSHLAPLTFDGFPGYTQPFPFGFHINPHTGTVRFRPMVVGEIAFIAVKAMQYKKVSGTYELVSEIMKEMVLEVQDDTANHFPYIDLANHEIMVCANGLSSMEFEVRDADTTDVISMKLLGKFPPHRFVPLSRVGAVRRFRVFFETDTAVYKGKYHFIMQACDNACLGSAWGTAEVGLIFDPVPLQAPSPYVQVNRECNLLKLEAQVPEVKQPVTYSWYFGQMPVKAGKNISQYIYNNNPVAFRMEIKYSTCNITIYDTLTDTLHNLHWNILANARSCRGQETELQVLPGGGTGVYRYQFDTSSTVIPNYQWKAGKSSLPVSMIDSGGCRKDTVLYFKVEDSLKINLPEYRICEGNEAAFFASIPVSGGVGPYATWWNGHINADSLRLQVSQDTMIPMVIIDSIGCTLSDTLRIKKHSRPSYVKLSDTVGCYSSVFHTELQHQMDASARFDWGTGYDLPSWLDKEESASGYRKVRIRDTAICEVSDSVFIRVYDTRPPQVTVNDTVFCEGAAFLDARVNTWNGSVSWYLAPFAAAGNRFLYDIPGSGTYSLSWVATDSIKCRHKGIRTISIKAKPEAAMTFTDLKICAGDPAFDFADSALVRGGSFFVNGIASSSFLPPVLGKGRHTVLHTRDSLGCSDSASLVLEIRNEPQVTFTADRVIGVALLPVKFTPSIFADTSYELHWDFGDPLRHTDTSSGISPVYTYRKKGFYTPSLTVNTGYCLKDHRIDSMIHVTAEVGVSLLETNMLEVYPNPGKGKFFVAFEGQFISGSVIDINGKEYILTPETSSGTASFNISHLAPGTYCLVWNTSQGTGKKMLITY